jgi:hypothetical protein
MGTLFVDKLDPQSGTSLEIGSSGDTITIPSGCTITNSGTDGGGFGGNNSPMWFVRKTSDQSLSSNSYTKVTWNSEVIDTDSAFASDKFTVPSGKAGKYYISTGVGFYDNNTQEHHYVLIYKNGSNVSADPSGITTVSDDTDRYWQTNNMILDLAVSDYVEVYVLCSYTSGTGTMNHSYFTGYKLIS